MPWQEWAFYVVVATVFFFAVFKWPRKVRNSYISRELKDYSRDANEKQYHETDWQWNLDPTLQLERLQRRAGIENV
jgi:hypothetical protein